MKIKDKMISVAEHAYDVTRYVLPPYSFHTIGSGIRTRFSGFRGIRFWNHSHPALEGSQVNYETLRSLYGNRGDNQLGAGFAKPIIDLMVSFMGIPRASTGNDVMDDHLNQCLSVYWVDEIQQMFRDSMRDSVAIAVLRKPDLFDPLMTIEETNHLVLEILPPERVDIERNFKNKRIIERILIRHRMKVVTDDGSIEQGVDPTTEEHEVIEVISRDNYRFFDQTKNEWLVELETPNTWRFVPALEIFNEWDSTLQGGQSDLETVIPFMIAFHEVVSQGLQAHTYHSTPKVVMNIDDIAPFLENNFPEAIDEETGSVKAGAEISWRGREILFMQTEDKVTFLEAKSVLGDTKVLAEFLIDCICIASQTPEWAFMRVDSGSANSDRNAQTVPFTRKINRKRNGYAKYVQELLKMVQVVLGDIPNRAKIDWDTIRPDDQLIENQAFQQMVMGLEVAAQRGEISDATYREMIRTFIPMMKNPTQEALAAKSNVQPALPQSTNPPPKNTPVENVQ